MGVAKLQIAWFLRYHSKLRIQHVLWVEVHLLPSDDARFTLSVHACPAANSRPPGAGSVASWQMPTDSPSGRAAHWPAPPPGQAEPARRNPSRISGCGREWEMELDRWSRCEVFAKQTVLRENTLSWAIYALSA